MAIPDFQTLMLPVLKFVADKKQYVLKDVVESLAFQFNLTDEDRSELLPSGSAFTFNNRVAWAASYLKKALLISRPRRGCIEITDRGLTVLKTNPEYINMKFLEQFPEYLEFKNSTSSETNITTLSNISSEQKSTPEEMLASTAKDLDVALAYDLLEIIKSSSPSFFERLVVQLLLAMGYGGSRAEAGRAIGQSGDGGIDGIIDEDKLGLDSIYIQAKRWEGTVGRPEIQKFVGALQGNRAHKGVFITTSDFSKEAQEYVKNISNKVVLINGFILAKLMIENDVGVSTISIYKVKKIDSDYFVDE
ncbi:restriction endonuclease [Methylovorus sp. MM2]|uniref:restriction endonuclease n=1 Tax=Methylovorus sp. MM2 TaxID=1848038 RepID=UPI0007DEDB14|nr:restriction endonuclease [Methylovorus sp. MM2]OAM52219.1 restriction endonuclease [Methylovorus sp. MM2]